MYIFSYHVSSLICGTMCHIKRTFQTRIEQIWELLMTEKVEGIEEEWSKVKSIFQDASVNTGAQEEQGKG